MKKQFFRVKQLADQTFLRADRSEGLNHDELKKADYKVEYISKALSDIGKKLPASLTSAEVLEKRKKKYYEYSLGASMLDFVGDERDDKMLLQYILKECGLAEMQLAEEQSAYESQVEQYVSAPINGIVEKELPNIYKQKKNLNKYVLDKDSATNRYQNASRNGTQKENLKEDMDEADIKVDQSRDALAAEMFGLLRKENEMCMHFLQLLKMQRSYHESAFKTLENIIPVLEQKIGESEVKPIFGCDLVEHLKITRRKLAFPLELCVLALTELGMSEEGLFRVVGGASRVKRFRLSIDSGCFSLPLIQEYRDVHVLASTLKSYLRELPEPLLTYSLYNDFMEAMKYPDEQRLLAVQEVLKKLPQQNWDNLAFLIQFLSNLSKHPENKMTSSNIAIVISPNLLWSTNEEINMHMKNCATVNAIVELFINNVDYFFSDLTSCCTIKRLDLLDSDVFHRPEVVGLKSVNSEHHDNYNIDTASPRPILRKKAKPAPAPPSSRNDPNDYSNEPQPESITSTYPSGSATLSRSHKIRTTDTSRTKLKNLEGDDDSSRRSSLVIEEKPTHKKVDVPNPTLVNLDSNVIEHKQSTATIQLAKPKLIQQSTAQIIEPDTHTNHLQKSSINNIIETIVKPVAAPRTSILCDTDKPSGAIVRRDSMSKSLNSIDIDGDFIQLRRSSKDELERPAKPAIPVRPASLRTTARTTVLDSDIQKTQCSVYSTPHKQQPSLVNIQNRIYMAGHDNQLAEKEKFLGQQQRPVVENKYNDINSNCDRPTIKPEVPSKPPLMKSTEKLNLEPVERINGNTKTSHVRTRSDGNIVDVHPDGIQLLQTPPSPRSLNKPSQPPPPPPTATKTKQEPD